MQKYVCSILVFVSRMLIGFLVFMAMQLFSWWLTIGCCVSSYALLLAGNCAEEQGQKHGES